jgi:hypothetical protein
MKTLALSLVLLVTVNAQALVTTWDFLYYAETDPWELQEELVEETPVVTTSGSFNS